MVIRFTMAICGCGCIVLASKDNEKPSLGHQNGAESASMDCSDSETRQMTQVSCCMHDEVRFHDLIDKSIFTPYPSVHIHCILSLYRLLSECNVLSTTTPHHHHITNHRSLAMRRL